MSRIEKETEEQIKNLAKECWQHYQNVKDYEFVFKPSIPILWFGDLEAYFNSNIKIVTVGSNPSDLEFAAENIRTKDENKNPIAITPSFRRFKGAEKINEKLNLSEDEITNYNSVLNHYFKDEKNRYNWFCCFEPILNGMNASYNERGAYLQNNEDYRESNYKNIAIHTDIYSPLATNPTWGNLNENQKDALSDGFTLWVKLINILKPDIMLMGYSPTDFEIIRKELKLEKDSDLDGVNIRYELCKDGREKKNTYVETYNYNLENSKTKILYGTKGNKPFDKITKPDRFKLGQELKAKFF